ncbi:hypothetical protein PoB_006947000 [Plakobranchus ocellatus]|uniref:Uncharacterized protein n=1 Tax=Plakobranchus ocellatus TaxID=259542 RepID=A0AAV4DG49_9GAST|nr:hypothetical protein PoB_006947000 [Plakobranchus ocellatus]
MSNDPSRSQGVFTVQNVKRSQQVSGHVYRPKCQTIPADPRACLPCKMPNDPSRSQGVFTVQNAKRSQQISGRVYRPKCQTISADLRAYLPSKMPDLRACLPSKMPNDPSRSQGMFTVQNAKRSQQISGCVYPPKYQTIPGRSQGIFTVQNVKKSQQISGRVYPPQEHQCSSEDVKKTIIIIRYLVWNGHLRSSSFTQSYSQLTL